MRVRVRINGASSGSHFILQDGTSRQAFITFAAQRLGIVPNSFDLSAVMAPALCSFCSGARLERAAQARADGTRLVRAAQARVTQAGVQAAQVQEVHAAPMQAAG